MTSGNIAVFDHDVTRHLDFVERAAQSLGLDVDAVHRTRSQVNTGMEQKAPGAVDIPVVQDLKKFIRESEAIAALAAVGIPPSAARFLDLPFYQTGEVRKRPLSDDDVAIVLRLFEDVRPDLVFVAGDLSDPHGTHRTCKAAIEQALTQYKAAQRPEVWLYRGAWQEWSLTEADVLVPLSQDELHAKILAIFRHQSQKDTAPFPGYDEREFWQRVEARNLETAARADRLGLPEYYAMEAYVIQRV
jgi:glucosamine-6-phosphate deaminase